MDYEKCTQPLSTRNGDSPQHFVSVLRAFLLPIASSAERIFGVRVGKRVTAFVAFLLRSKMKIVNAIHVLHDVQNIA